VASRRLSDLTRPCHEAANRFLLACEAAGIDVLITCTLRLPAEQAALYARGRTAPGPVVTYAKPGSSKHETGEAFDVVPIVSGKPCWDIKNPIWQLVGQIGRDSGLRWGGDFERFKDYPHFETNRVID